MRTGVRASALLLLATALVGCIATSPNTGLSPGRPAPAIRGIDADEKSFQLSDFRGKVVLLDFWATY
jgi:hypothetical protein